jgi:hypothetical protein
MASEYNLFMRKELFRLKAAHPKMDHKSIAKQAMQNWKDKEGSSSVIRTSLPPPPKKTRYSGIVSAEDPYVERERSYEDETDAYAFTIGQLLSVLCERDPRNIQNQVLIDFNQRVQASDRSEYPTLLEELNNIVKKMGKQYKSVVGFVETVIV